MFSGKILLQSFLLEDFNLVGDAVRFRVAEVYAFSSSGLLLVIAVLICVALLART